MLVNKSIAAAVAAGSLVSILSAQGTTTRVSVSSTGVQGSAQNDPCTISDDGRWVCFTSSSLSLVIGLPNSTVRVFLHDRQTGTTEVVAARNDGYFGLWNSADPAISGSGSHVAFRYDGDDLLTTDTNGRSDIYIRDIGGGSFEQVSVSSTGQQGNDGSLHPVLSHDGRYVAFESGATNFFAGDISNYDIFVKDRQTSILTCVTQHQSGGPSNGTSWDASMSADARFIAYQSTATNLTPSIAGPQPYLLVHDRTTGSQSFIVVSMLGQTPNGQSESPMISANGRYIAYVSAATNLVVNDTNGVRDVFLFDLQTTTTTRVSVSSTGIQANAECERPRISLDGNVISFHSYASTLVPGDTWALRDVFVRSRSQSLTTRVSVSSSGAPGNNSSSYHAISGNGQHVAFISEAGNLAPNDTNGTHDCFVHSIGCPTPQSYCTAGTTTGGCVPWISGTGTPSVSAASGFDIVVNEVDGQRFGLIYYGFAPASASWGIGSTSYICVAPPTQRTLITGTGGTNATCDGSLILDFNAYMAANPGSLGSPFTTGQVIYAQGWFRDPGAVKQTNLSDGLRFTLCD